MYKRAVSSIKASTLMEFLKNKLSLNKLFENVIIKVEWIIINEMSLIKIIIGDKTVNAV